MTKKSVIDINSGLGGRAYAFLKAGYKIEALIEGDKENSSILKSVFKDALIIDESPNDIDVSQIPNAAVISAQYIQQSFSVVGKSKTKNTDSINSFILNVIRQKNPNIIILEVPVICVLHRKEILERDLQKYRDLGYRFSYSVMEEKKFSGYPVYGRQAYFVGTINGENDEIDHLFQMPAVADKELFMEDAESIDAWYRMIRFSYENWECNKLYVRERDDVKLSEHIHTGYMRENYIVDKLGPRRITHNELANIKGLYKWNFNKCKNKRRMYQKLSYETNVYIVYEIANNISLCIKDTNLDYPKETIRLVDKKKNTKKTKKIDNSKIVFPKLFVKEMHISKLKGLYNLDLVFDKNLVAIMGVNGAGKSTILHALACINNRYEKGEEYKFNYFFTPTTDTTWKDSCFTVVTYDENEKKTSEKTFMKNKKRWINYADRPKRDIYYLGVSTCIPEIEIEKTKSFINYISNQDNGKNAKNIVNDASYILNKDYTELLLNETSKKKYMGVSTQEGVSYSSLSMGAGEQRVIKILQMMYSAHQYSMLLIDELDLLLHADAFRKLVEKISDIASKKHMQIIFTTHSMEMTELTKFADIRYIEKKPGKYVVYDSIKPDLLYGLSGKKIKKYIIYVEDTLAEAIVRKIAKEVNMLRHISIIPFGSIENGFTVAAGMVLGGGNVSNILVVTDGDKYISQEERRKQIEKVLSGNENWHEERVEKALSIITQFNLPINTAPEKYIWEILKKSTDESEYVECAKRIKAVSDTHEYIGEIKKEMGTDDRIYDDIIDIISNENDWEPYIHNIKSWLLEKSEEIK